MRKNIVVGNWKMNLQRQESLDFGRKIISIENNDVEVVLILLILICTR